MAVNIPKFSDFLMPTLKAAASLGGTGSISEIVARVIDLEQFSTAQQAVLHKDGPGTEISYRIAWARTYLKYFGFLTNSSRGVWTITKSGEQFLTDPALTDSKRIVELLRMKADRIRVASQERAARRASVTSNPPFIGEATGLTSESVRPTRSEGMTSGEAISEIPENDAATNLYASLTSHGALPYLFVGSGISRRYLNLPDWEGLLRQFATEADENFNFHLATANGYLPAAATSVAQSFHQHWWKDDAYADQRETYSTIVRDDEGGLKVAIAEFIRANDILTAGVPGVDDPALATEIQLLAKVVVDGVITTNYDSLTDQLFPTFQPYVGQDELLMSDAQFIAETYKIHGAASQPLSLVLTEGDYERFSNRNHYLAAKLLTIFAEHPVIFVGYSLGDEYLNEILDNIATAVGPERLGELGKRIYFVEWNPDASAATIIEQTSIERGGSRLPITRIETHGFSWIWEVLTRLERPFPAAILRELRKHVFDLVTHPDPAQTREVVRAIPIDTDEGNEYRVVFGVGAFSEKDLQNLSTIGRTLRRDDVEQDVLGIRKRSLEPENLLRSGIPDAIRPAPNAYLPVHKYLQETGRMTSDASIDYDGLPEVIRQLAERPLEAAAQSKSRFDREVKGVLTTPRQVLDSSYTMYFKLDSLILLDPEPYSAQDLRDALVELHGTPDASSQTNRALFRRVVCVYDRRKALEEANLAGHSEKVTRTSS